VCLLVGVACTDAETSQSALQVAAPNTPAAEPSVPNVVPKQAGQPIVAFLGDSIAAGQYLTSEQAFPSVLERQLRTFVLLDASERSDTTADGLRRLPEVLRRKPKIVVVALGENDKSQAVSVRDVEANLREILVQVHAADAQALLLGVSSEPDRNAERTSGASYARELAAMFPRVAAELDVPFVPFLQGVAGRRELTLPDGVHPTPEGHQRIAGHVIGPLRALLAP
jgi:acyl-CoA thioesterase I